MILTKNSKNKFLAFITFVFILVIILLSGYLLYRNFQVKSLEKSTQSFVEFIRNDSTSRASDKKPVDNVERQLKIVSDLKLPKKTRYDALSVLAYYYSNEYAQTNEPSVRAVGKNILGEYAKENFEDLYNDSMFNFVCADTKCGRSIPPEIKKVLDLVEKNTDLSSLAKDTISLNLKNAGYMTDDEASFGLQLSAFQLQREGTPAASDAAKILLEYLKKEYNYTQKIYPK